MSELRQRPTAATSGSKRDTDTTASRQPRRPSEGSCSISVLDIIRVLATLLIASCGLSYYVTNSESVLWGYRPWYTRWPIVKSYLTGPVLLTPSQLSLYNGSDPSLPIYLAVNGSIFDVSANPAMYGPGGGYSFFSGRDATRAFVTGCFKEDLTSDLLGAEEMFLPVEDVEDEGITSAQKKIRREKEVRVAKQQVHKTVARWESFFRNHKRYFQVGRVIDDGDGNERKGKRPLCEGAQGQRPKRSEMKD
ncbi:hypothetical protein N7532_006988 [Penicillium argentinense]|uniref:Cytochrome b5 heme-binding domain-containing protein n=1 Tax=Penicillium argentinense TaxID=1131581 RepID=A0A9W9FGX9_9EURO|nr:uncharacterized protein N7532_006988 [Penicillium argentinense]KAJ5099987.1 hypothetical protein N7532_006988 [Penicillium argentinense]